MTEQLLTWAVAIVSWIQQQCANVAQQVQQWQQQWQNQCTQVSSQVCNSLFWPLSALCSLVTSVVCTLVSILVLVVVTVIQLVCTAITVLAMSLVVTLLIVLLTLIFTLCVIIPGSAPMEGSSPPDGGWIVTLGLATPPRLSESNTVQILPDGQRACASIIAAIASATRTINLFQLEFDSTFIATFADNTPQTLLTQALIAASANGVSVRILMNDNLFDDSIPQLQTAFMGTTIQVQGLDIKPVGMMHAKGMFVDSATAFVDGLPFAQGYWDTQLHLVTDSRRGSGAGGDFPPFGDVGNGVGNKPAHTVSLRIDGPAAADIDATFISIWNSVSSNTAPPVIVPSGTGSQAIQIVRTAPRLSASGLTNGEKGVLEAYLRAIHNARTFIYMEVQYLTSPVIGAALASALSGNPGLQVILLLNENPDMPTYKFWQNTLLSGLGAFATRVGAFALWRTKTQPGGQAPKIMQCYLEAKVSIVDDVWATVGSGNLDGASLGHVFEFLPSPLSCLSALRGWRNVELNAVLYDGIAGQPATGEVATLRRVLWREHLGIEIPASAPPGGWLKLWSDIAASNVASLNSSQAMGGSADSPSRILPYASALDTEEQLMQVGVNTALLDVAPAVPQ